jgi:hypothetical protein
MKKIEMKKLALLGIAAGVLTGTQATIQAAENENSINLEHVIAKPKCKAHGGCGGLTASRDVPPADEESLDDAEEVKVPKNAKDQETLVFSLEPVSEAEV